MKSEVRLPEEVVVEIEADRRAEAIDLLRMQPGVDQEQAERMVDNYIEANKSTPEQDSAGFGRIVILVIGVSIIFGIYKFLS